MPSKGPYQIEDFTCQNLTGFFLNDDLGLDREQILEKPQIKSLIEYCHMRGVSQLVLEREYMDRFFSEDYSGYYTRSFRRYDKVCGRLHLFTSKISKEEFERLLAGTNATTSLSEDLGYRGFIVVKPLPHTMVGRTCLAPLPPLDATEHVFPTLTSVKSNLFGLPLNVRSLPFQEQDREVAACATSALWTTLYVSAHAYQHRLLSPLQITKLASTTLPSARSLPNDGLQIEHITGVIRTLGLECELIRVGGEQSTPSFQSYIAAYLRVGIPLVLSFDFSDSTPEPLTAELHAVAVAGYRIKQQEVEPDRNGFKLRATLINRLFVHDDRIGPFSPLDIPERERIEGGELAQADVTDDIPRVVTGWKDSVGDRKPAYLVSLTIPIHRQVRIPYKLIWEAVLSFDSILGLAISAGNFDGVRDRPEWDIYLCEINQFRDSVRRDASIPAAERVAVLTSHLPRFIWRALAYINGKPEIDLLFDATDLRQGRILQTSICHTKEIYNAIAGASATARPTAMRSTEQVPLELRTSHRLLLAILRHFQEILEPPISK